MPDAHEARGKHVQKEPPKKLFDAKRHHAFLVARLTLNVPVTFLPAFLGPLGNYVNATDQAGNSSGWQELGTWTAYAASSQPATVNSVTPSSGTGTAQTFTYSISDVNGYEYLGNIIFTINSSDSAVNACVFSFYPSGNQIFLLNNADTAWLPPATLGSSGTLSNSQCQLSLSGSSMSGSGNNLTIMLALTFASTFTGIQNQYVLAADHAGNYPSIGPYATWTTEATTITVTSAPLALSLTVDGNACTTPCPFQWVPGSTHTLNVPAQLKKAKRKCNQMQPRLVRICSITICRTQGQSTRVLILSP